MRYKISVNCPDNDQIVSDILDAAARAGAGAGGNYSRVAMILRGHETWKPEEGAHPFIGNVGEISIEPSARIEMQCRPEVLTSVIQAIREVHPYEEPVIEIVKLEDLKL